MSLLMIALVFLAFAGGESRPKAKLYHNTPPPDSREAMLRRAKREEDED